MGRTWLPSWSAEATPRRLRTLLHKRGRKLRPLLGAARAGSDPHGEPVLALAGGRRGRLAAQHARLDELARAADGELRGERLGKAELCDAWKVMPGR